MARRLSTPITKRSRGRLVIELVFGLGIAALLLGILRWMASEVFEGETDAFDAALRSAVHSMASPPLTTFFIAVSFIGSPGFVVVAAILIVAALFYFGLKRQAVLVVLTMAGEVALDVCLKGIYERARPEPFFDYALPASFSFPSGHALGSMCFYGIIAWLLATRSESPLFRQAAPFAAATLIILIGLSRVYLGVHYPTDVLAGFVAGTVWTATVCLGDRYVLKRGSVA